MRRAVEALPAPLGLSSFLLLLASLRWAHHWSSPRTDVLVAAWTATTVAVFAVAYRLRGRGVMFLRLGVAFGCLSLAALGIVGVAWGAGYDPAGACGGG
jgi:hypothetical protein